MKVSWWPFRSAKNVAVITTKSITSGDKPVLVVTHDEDDGSWQFLDGEPVSADAATLVSLAKMASIDPTIAELADLPLGWVAWREDVSAPWDRAPRDQPEGEA